MDLHLVLTFVFIFALSISGCYSSHETHGEADSSDVDSDYRNDAESVTIQTDEDGSGIDAPIAGSGDIDSDYPNDAESVAIQTGEDGEELKGNNGADSGVISVYNAPCKPNCPKLEWIAINSGTFLMGSPDGEGGRPSEYPQHEVTVQRFKILKTEVTVSQFAKCVEAGFCSVPYEGMPTASHINWRRIDRENHPMNNVSWTDAKKFTEWIGARLPTEAEWEYAARGEGRDILYPWGDETATCDYAIIQEQPSGLYGCGNSTTAEVCSRPLGNSVQGLCDMAGNVEEWVEDDLHWTYDGAPSNGQAWIDNPRSSLRVLRGGSRTSDDRNCTTTLRLGAEYDSMNGNYGFRAVRDFNDHEK